MSEQKRIRGKLKKIEIKTTLENTAKEIMSLTNPNSTLPSGYDSYIEWLKDEGNYVFVNKELYEIIEKNNVDPYRYYCDLTYNDDNTIDFVTSFYNGGACLLEMLEDELKQNICSAN